jgi:hypothetical protein
MVSKKDFFVDANAVLLVEVRVMQFLPGGYHSRFEVKERVAGGRLCGRSAETAEMSPQMQQKLNAVLDFMITRRVLHLPFAGQSRHVQILVLGRPDSGKQWKRSFSFCDHVS